MEHIKDRIADFGAFKEELGMNKIICNKIQTSISLWKEDLETVIENNEGLFSSEIDYYYWFSFDGLKSIISLKPFEHFESEKTRIEKKRQFLIDKRKKLCEHGGLHPMIPRKEKVIAGKVYNTTKETFIKIGNLRVCWDLIQVKKFQISLIMTNQRAI